ncbi:hypothetical protein [Micromonospora chersina]|uniref:hypothetical protein n=1 Tax=Micromonospora chersina TaxID=47854 RepID=UPI003711BF88
MSVAANVAHSYIRPEDAPAAWSPQPGAVVGSIFWPVALFVCVEILARVAWPSGRRWTALRFGGALPVALVAALVSYRHLSGLLTAYGEDVITATVGPLAVDGLALISAGALLATGRRRVAEAADVSPVAVSPVATPGPALPASAGPTTPATARPQVTATVKDSGRADDWRAADVSPAGLALVVDDAEADMPPKPSAARVAVAAAVSSSPVLSSPVLSSPVASRHPRQSSADAVRAAAEEDATPATVAAALGVSVRTVQRHWPGAATATA